MPSTSALVDLAPRRRASAARPSRAAARRAGRRWTVARSPTARRAAAVPARSPDAARGSGACCHARGRRRGGPPRTASPARARRPSASKTNDVAVEDELVLAADLVHVDDARRSLSAARVASMRSRSCTSSRVVGRGVDVHDHARRPPAPASAIGPVGLPGVLADGDARPATPAIANDGSRSSPGVK